MKPPARGARGGVARLRLPEPALLFRERAARLAALAAGHAAGPYLLLLSRLAEGQRRAVVEGRLALEAGDAAPGHPPLEAERVVELAGPSRWREALAPVLAAAGAGELPEPALAAVARLRAASDAALAGMAREALTGSPRDRAAAPFVGAALQAGFALLSSRLDPESVPPSSGGCPVCGTGPAASVVLGDERLRYLACGLCAAEWYLPRARCAACGESDQLFHLSVEVDPPGAVAETCERCHCYLKLLDLERTPGAEPVADDAATLVLDVALGDRGYHRAGPNLLAPAGEPA